VQLFKTLNHVQCLGSLNLMPVSMYSDLSISSVQLGYMLCKKSTWKNVEQTCIQWYRMDPGLFICTLIGQEEVKQW